MKTLLGAALALNLIPAPAFAQSEADEKELRLQVEASQAAWAKGDVQAMASSMAEDVDFVTVGALWLKGRRDFVTYHTRLLHGRFKGSTQTPLQTAVRFVRPDLALLRYSWAIEGDRNVDGTPRFKRYGLMTMLAEKRKGKWLIISAQNTNAGGPSPEAAGIKSPIQVPSDR